MRCSVGNCPTLRVSRLTEPPEQRQFADDGLHQRGLAGAVAAKNGDAAAPGNAQRDTEQHLAAAIARVDILDIEIFVLGQARRR
jgi:hypothetical protein